MNDNLDAQRNALAFTRAVILGDAEAARDLYFPLDEDQRLTMTVALAAHAHGYILAGIIAKTGLPADQITPEQIAECIQAELASLAAAQSPPAPGRAEA